MQKAKKGNSKNIRGCREQSLKAERFCPKKYFEPALKNYERQALFGIPYRYIGRV